METRFVVVEHPLVPGVSEWLTQTITNLEDNSPDVFVSLMATTVYTDLMSEKAQPMLVATLQVADYRSEPTDEGGELELLIPLDETLDPIEAEGHLHDPTPDEDSLLYNDYIAER